MERRLNKKLELYITSFKDDIREKATQIGILENNGSNELLQFIYDYNRLSFNKEDFMKRKRCKNIVNIYERCCAKRANGDNCSRRKKENSNYCGTHIKGTPHGIIEKEDEILNTEKIEVFAQDIKGIIYYIDKMGNVYDTEDIMKSDKHPKRIIAKYQQDSSGKYSIPSMFSS